MQRQWRRVGGLVAGVVIVVVWTGSSRAQDGEFEVRLSTVPISAAEQASITGHGAATATLDGRELSISASFDGLQRPATGATLRLGPATGVRGDVIASLEVTQATQATQGTLTATVNLSRSQVQALRDGRIYLQIDSEAGPDGNLWGWLLD